MKIYVVCEYDWESQVAIEAYTDEVRAQRRAEELDNPLIAYRAAHPSAIHCFHYEEIELFS